MNSWQLLCLILDGNVAILIANNCKKKKYIYILRKVTQFYHWFLYNYSKLVPFKLNIWPTKEMSSYQTGQCLNNNSCVKFILITVNNNFKCHHHYQHYIPDLLFDIEPINYQSSHQLRLLDINTQLGAFVRFVLKNKNKKYIYIVDVKVSKIVCFTLP